MAASRPEVKHNADPNTLKPQLDFTPHLPCPCKPKSIVPHGHSTLDQFARVPVVVLRGGEGDPVPVVLRGALFRALAVEVQRFVGLERILGSFGGLLMAAANKASCNL